METIGDRIRAARQRYGMSQAELARRIPLSKTAMNDIERGLTCDPRFSVVARIAAVLSVSMDQFVPREDYAPPGHATAVPVRLTGDEADPRISGTAREEGESHAP